MNKKPCIGLFGTCGNSTWRAAFIRKYEELGIAYFNPQVPEWNPTCAAKEAHHHAHDEIILYPILGETYGIGSLAESGFAVVQALKEGASRHILLFIEPEVALNLKEASSQLTKESERTRQLVLAHLHELQLPTVHECHSLEQMLTLSIRLAQGA